MEILLINTFIMPYFIGIISFFDFSTNIYTLENQVEIFNRNDFLFFFDFFDINYFFIQNDLFSTNYFNNIQCHYSTKDLPIWWGYSSPILKFHNFFFDFRIDGSTIRYFFFDAEIKNYLKYYYGKSFSKFFFSDYFFFDTPFYKKTYYLNQLFFINDYIILFNTFSYNLLLHNFFFYWSRFFLIDIIYEGFFKYSVVFLNNGRFFFFKTLEYFLHLNYFLIIYWKKFFSIFCHEMFIYLQKIYYWSISMCDFLRYEHWAFELTLSILQSKYWDKIFKYLEDNGFWVFINYYIEIINKNFFFKYKQLCSFFDEKSIYDYKSFINGFRFFSFKDIIVPLFNWNFFFYTMDFSLFFYEYLKNYIYIFKYIYIFFFNKKDDVFYFLKFIFLNFNVYLNFLYVYLRLDIYIYFFKWFFFFNIDLLYNWLNFEKFNVEFLYNWLNFEYFISFFFFFDLKFYKSIFFNLKNLNVDIEFFFFFFKKNIMFFYQNYFLNFLNIIDQFFYFLFNGFFFNIKILLQDFYFFIYFFILKYILNFYTLIFFEEFFWKKFKNLGFFFFFDNNLKNFFYFFFNTNYNYLSFINEGFFFFKVNLIRKQNIFELNLYNEFYKKNIIFIEQKNIIKDIIRFFFFFETKLNYVEKYNNIDLSSLDFFYKIQPFFFKENINLENSIKFDNSKRIDWYPEAFFFKILNSIFYNNGKLIDYNKKKEWFIYSKDALNWFENLIKYFFIVEEKQLTFTENLNKNLEFFRFLKKKSILKKINLVFNKEKIYLFFKYIILYINFFFIFNKKLKQLLKINIWYNFYLFFINIIPLWLNILFVYFYKMLFNIFFYLFFFLLNFVKKDNIVFLKKKIFIEDNDIWWIFSSTESLFKLEYIYNFILEWDTVVKKNNLNYFFIEQKKKIKKNKNFIWYWNIFTIKNIEKKELNFYENYNYWKNKKFYWKKNKNLVLDGIFRVIRWYLFFWLKNSYNFFLHNTYFFFFFSNWTHDILFRSTPITKQVLNFFSYMEVSTVLSFLIYNHKIINKLKLNLKNTKNNIEILKILNFLMWKKQKDNLTWKERKELIELELKEILYSKEKKASLVQKLKLIYAYINLLTINLIFQIFDSFIFFIKKPELEIKKNNLLDQLLPLGRVNTDLIYPHILMNSLYSEIYLRIEEITSNIFFLHLNLWDYTKTMKNNFLSKQKPIIILDYSLIDFLINNKYIENFNLNLNLSDNKLSYKKLFYIIFFNNIFINFFFFNYFCKYFKLEFYIKFFSFYLFNFFYILIYIYISFLKKKHLILYIFFSKFLKYNTILNLLVFFKYKLNYLFEILFNKLLIHYSLKFLKYLFFIFIFFFFVFYMFSLNVDEVFYLFNTLINNNIIYIISYFYFFFFELIVYVIEFFFLKTLILFFFTWIIEIKKTLYFDLFLENKNIYLNIWKEFSYDFFNSFLYAYPEKGFTTGDFWAYFYIPTSIIHVFFRIIFLFIIKNIQIYWFLFLDLWSYWVDIFYGSKISYKWYSTILAYYHWFNLVDIGSLYIFFIIFKFFYFILYFINLLLNSILYIFIFFIYILKFSIFFILFVWKNILYSIFFFFFVFKYIYYYFFFFKLYSFFYKICYILLYNIFIIKMFFNFYIFLYNFFFYYSENLWKNINWDYIQFLRSPVTHNVISMHGNAPVPNYYRGNDNLHDYLWINPIDDMDWWLYSILNEMRILNYFKSFISIYNEISIAKHLFFVIYIFFIYKIGIGMLSWLNKWYIYMYFNNDKMYWFAPYLTWENFDIFKKERYFINKKKEDLSGVNFFLSSYNDLDNYLWKEYKSIAYKTKLYDFILGKSRKLEKTKYKMSYINHILHERFREFISVKHDYILKQEEKNIKNYIKKQKNIYYGVYIKSIFFFKNYQIFWYDFIDKFLKDTIDIHGKHLYYEYRSLFGWPFLLNKDKYNRLFGPLQSYFSYFEEDGFNHWYSFDFILKNNWKKVIDEKYNILEKKNVYKRRINYKLKTMLLKKKIYIKNVQVLYYLKKINKEYYFLNNIQTPLILFVLNKNFIKNLEKEGKLGIISYMFPYLLPKKKNIYYKFFILEKEMFKKFAKVAFGPMFYGEFKLSIFTKKLFKNLAQQQLYFFKKSNFKNVWWNEINPENIIYKQYYNMRKWSTSRGYMETSRILFNIRENFNKYGQIRFNFFFWLAKINSNYFNNYLNVYKQDTLGTFKYAKPSLENDKYEEEIRNYYKNLISNINKDNFLYNYNDEKILNKEKKIINWNLSWKDTSLIENINKENEIKEKNIIDFIEKEEKKELKNPMDLYRHVEIEESVFLRKSIDYELNINPTNFAIFFLFTYFPFFMFMDVSHDFYNVHQFYIAYKDPYCLYLFKGYDTILKHIYRNIEYEDFPFSKYIWANLYYLIVKWMNFYGVLSYDINYLYLDHFFNKYWLTNSFQSEDWKLARKSRVFGTFLVRVSQENFITDFFLPQYPSGLQQNFKGLLLNTEKTWTNINSIFFYKSFFFNRFFSYSLSGFIFFDLMEKLKISSVILKKFKDFFFFSSYDLNLLYSFLYLDFFNESLSNDIGLKESFFLDIQQNKFLYNYWLFKKKDLLWGNDRFFVKNWLNVNLETTNENKPGFITKQIFFNSTFFQKFTLLPEFDNINKTNNYFDKNISPNFFDILKIEDSRKKKTYEIFKLFNKKNETFFFYYFDYTYRDFFWSDKWTKGEGFWPYIRRNHLQIFKDLRSFLSKIVPQNEIILKIRQTNKSYAYDVRFFFFTFDKFWIDNLQNVDSKLFNKVVYFFLNYEKWWLIYFFKITYGFFFTELINILKDSQVFLLNNFEYFYFNRENQMNWLLQWWLKKREIHSNMQNPKDYTYYGIFVFFFNLFFFICIYFFIFFFFFFIIYIFFFNVNFIFFKKKKINNNFNYKKKIEEFKKGKRIPYFFLEKMKINKDLAKNLKNLKEFDDLRENFYNKDDFRNIDHFSFIFFEIYEKKNKKSLLNCYKIERKKKRLKNIWLKKKKNINIVLNHIEKRNYLYKKNIFINLKLNILKKNKDLILFYSKVFFYKEIIFKYLDFFIINIRYLNFLLEYDIKFEDLYEKNNLEILNYIVNNLKNKDDFDNMLNNENLIEKNLIILFIFFYYELNKDNGFFFNYLSKKNEKLLKFFLRWKKKENLNENIKNFIKESKNDGIYILYIDFINYLKNKKI